MSANLQASYFSFTSPLALIDRWLHPLRFQAQVMLRGQPLQLQWSRRAARQLAQRDTPLLMEMQLYFSCVVKKRVLFHEPATIAGLQSVKVNEQMLVAFRAVQSTSCDPVEFAENYPVQQEFQSPAAQKLHPKQLQLDYRKGQWQAEFSL